MYYLSRIKHPSIVCLLYHFTISASADEKCHCMVFDYLPTDMSKLKMQQPGRRFNSLDAKLYGFQLFSAIDYVNSLGIAHRDVKPSNMIVDPTSGIMKLADFGNAKYLRACDTNTSYQVTRYYRAPELVFGATHYTTAIDIWACGCVLAEFTTGKVLLQGRKGEQPRLIIDIFGYPTKEQITAMNIKRPRYAHRSARTLKVALEGSGVSDKFLELLGAILRYEPKLRMHGCEVLADEFFDELRSKPPPIRSNGYPIPRLDYNIVENSMATRVRFNRSCRNQGDISCTVRGRKCCCTFTGIIRIRSCDNSTLRFSRSLCIFQNHSKENRTPMKPTNRLNDTVTGYDSEKFDMETALKILFINDRRNDRIVMKLFAEEAKALDGVVKYLDRDEGAHVNTSDNDDYVVNKIQPIANAKLEQEKNFGHPANEQSLCAGN